MPPQRSKLSRSRRRDGRLEVDFAMVGRCRGDLAVSAAGLVVTAVGADGVSGARGANRRSLHAGHRGGHSRAYAGAQAV